MPAAAGLQVAHQHRAVVGDAVAAGAAGVLGQAERGRQRRVVHRDRQLRREALIAGPVHHPGAEQIGAVGQASLTGRHGLPAGAAIAGALVGDRGVALAAGDPQREAVVGADEVAAAQAAVGVIREPQLACHGRGVHRHRAGEAGCGAEVAVGVGLAHADAATGIAAGRQLKAAATAVEPAAAAVEAVLPAAAGLQVAHQHRAVAGDPVGAGAAGVLGQVQRGRDGQGVDHHSGEAAEAGA